MSLERIVCNSREEWLANRTVGIGASEAAAIVGQSKWMTAEELWELKTGKRKAKDISDNPAVSLGVRLEPALRDMFAGMHPELTVEHHPYDMLYQSERPWLFATLDGELTDNETGEKSVLEVKTATPSGKVGWNEWANGSMKPQYYVQTLHQLLATGYARVHLIAALFRLDGDVIVRTYTVDRNDETVMSDMDFLLQSEIQFYKQIETGKRPHTRLSI